MRLLPREKELYISLFSYLKPYKTRIFLAASTMIILGLIRAAVVYLVGPFVKNVFITKDINSLKIFFIILPILFVIRMLAE